MQQEGRGVEREKKKDEKFAPFFVSLNAGCGCGERNWLRLLMGESFSNLPFCRLRY
jgi:hypothetical protein